MYIQIIFMVDKLTIELLPHSKYIQYLLSTLTSTLPTNRAELAPRTTAAIPLWIIYAVVQGTLATGPWVIGALAAKNQAFADEKQQKATGCGWLLRMKHRET